MTNLQEISQNNLSISLSNLPIDLELVRDIQARLNKIGFIDMTALALGTFDVNTSTALAKFQGIARRLPTDNIDRSIFC